MPRPRKRVLLAATNVRDALVRGVVRFARRHDWQLVTDMLHTGAFPRGWMGDGIIASPAYQPDLSQYIANSGIPSVAVVLEDESISIPGVESDNAAIGRMAANHLLSLGAKQFAWAAFVNDRQSRERLAGFEAALHERGRTCKILPPMHRRIGPFWHDDWNARRALLMQKLRELARPAAIFASNDCVAADLADACAECGLAVPEDISILGVGNHVLECEASSPQLSSIDCGVEDMAYQAAELLAGLMCGARRPEENLRVAPKGLVLRFSTGGMNSSYPRITEAIAYITENYPDPLFSVSAVADAVGLCRRQLERDFRQVTGCTVRDYIERERMNEAIRLLRDHPRTKITAIAELVGMSGSANFIRTFRRHFGTTPSAYRFSHAGAEEATPASARPAPGEGADAIQNLRLLRTSLADAG